MIERIPPTYLRSLIQADLESHEGRGAVFRFFELLSRWPELHHLAGGRWASFVDPGRLLATIRDFRARIPTESNSSKTAIPPALNYYFLAAYLMEAWKVNAPADDFPELGAYTNGVLAYYLGRMVVVAGSGGGRGVGETRMGRERLLLWLCDPGGEKKSEEIARILSQMDKPA